LYTLLVFGAAVISLGFIISVLLLILFKVARATVNRPLHVCHLALEFIAHLVETFN
jgi:hypothetical protein